MHGRYRQLQWHFNSRSHTGAIRENIQEIILTSIQFLQSFSNSHTF